MSVVVVVDLLIITYIVLEVAVIVLALLLLVMTEASVQVVAVGSRFVRSKSNREIHLCSGVKEFSEMKSIHFSLKTLSIVSEEGSSEDHKQCSVDLLYNLICTSVVVTMHHMNKSISISNHRS